MVWVDENHPIIQPGYDLLQLSPIRPGRRRGNQPLRLGGMTCRPGQESKPNSTVTLSSIFRVNPTRGPRMIRQSRGVKIGLMPVIAAA